MSLRIALPSGSLLPATKAYLERASLSFEGYESSARHYHLTGADGLAGTVLHEKDIPIQVAIGNYALGICGLDWLLELQSKYPESPILKLHDLDYGALTIHAVVSSRSEVRDPASLRAYVGRSLRIVSKYPNLAERFAVQHRLPRFAVFPVWERAEAYLPEHAEVAVIGAQAPGELAEKGLRPIETLVKSSACLVANRDLFASQDLSGVLDRLLGAAAAHA